MNAHPNNFHSSLAFFARNPIFTHEEFLAARAPGERSKHTSNALLSWHLAKGRLSRVRRGLYASVPVSAPPKGWVPDPYLVTTKLRPDAVVAYHSALSFHGKAYSLWSRHQYLTADRPRPFTFRGQEFVGVQVPLAIRHLSDFGGGVKVLPHAGGEVRVTTLERCMVDLLHAPQHGGGWEEIWRSLEMVEFLDLDVVGEYALLMGSALTAARVGFFLEQHRAEWMVEEKHLDLLRRHAPKQPQYLDARRASGTLVSPWNLIVPADVLERRWEETP